MSNAISNISSALGYDAVETMLASGRPLSECYAFASLASDMASDKDVSPASVRSTELATVRPAKKAA
jgi:hypothetical protein